MPIYKKHLSAEVFEKLTQEIEENNQTANTLWIERINNLLQGETKTNFHDLDHDAKDNKVSDILMGELIGTHRSNIPKLTQLTPKGLIPANANRLVKLATLWGISIDYLVGLSNTKQPEAEISNLHNQVKTLKTQIKALNDQEGKPKDQILGLQEENETLKKKINMQEQIIEGLLRQNKKDTQ